jgi:ribulose-5-phosphate 4-epimerase/fuculose-1-phosphate aldolase
MVGREKMNVHSAPKREISAEEKRIRRELAACYRMTAMFGWDDLVATHISARLPGEEAFLLNPYGLLFEEITASTLVKVDPDGNVLDDSPYPVNRAGFIIHSAIHQARHDAACVIHLHTHDGVAVSALEEGILPLNQSAMLLRDTIAFHEYEGIATQLEERERLVADLGDKNLMLLRNHGTLALGPTIAEAFTAMYFLEWACTTQVRTLAMGQPLHSATPQSMAAVTATRNAIGARVALDLVWPAMMRKVARECVGFDG